MIRAALDAAEHTDVSILAYSAKYASAFFGPFREAVDSSLQGDRRTYQQDPANALEGVREALLDVEQGADIVMVKPALAYLDVRPPGARRGRRARWRRTTSPASTPWSRPPPPTAGSTASRAILETLTSIRRAGADVILTYWAAEAARLLAADGACASRSGDGFTGRPVNLWVAR